MSDVFDVLSVVAPCLFSTASPAPRSTASRGRWGGIGRECRPLAGAAIKEPLDQIGKNAPGERAVQERSVNRALPADPGEMGNHVARGEVAEDEPGLAFIGHAAVGLEREPGLPQRFEHAMEMRQLLPGPALAMDAQLAPACCAFPRFPRCHFAFSQALITSYRASRFAINKFGRESKKFAHRASRHRQRLGQNLQSTVRADTRRLRILTTVEDFTGESFAVANNTSPKITSYIIG